MSSLRENSIKKCRGVVKSCQIVPNLFKAPRKFFLDFLSPLLYNTKGGEGKSLFKQARPRVQLSFSYFSFALARHGAHGIIILLLSFRTGAPSALGKRYLTTTLAQKTVPDASSERLI